MELHKVQERETNRDQRRSSSNHRTLEDGGSLLLHPNYGAACPVSSLIALLMNVTYHVA